MSDAGVSMHVAQLRKELDDPLFSRTSAGLAFTPGGLRLASRAVEILGLQQQTAIEVTEAAHGRRLLRVAASSAFAEHAAPGLIELFSSRAKDLSVELSVQPTSTFRELVTSRAVDVALGQVYPPDNAARDATVVVRPFLNYQILTVTAPRGRWQPGRRLRRCCASSNGCWGRRQAAPTARSLRPFGSWRSRKLRNESSRAMQPRSRKS